MVIKSGDTAPRCETAAVQGSHNENMSESPGSFTTAGNNKQDGVIKRDIPS